METNNNEIFLGGCNITGNQALVYGGGIFMQNQNNFFMMLDLQAYQNLTIVQSEHPYQSGEPSSQDNPYIILEKNVNIPEADRLIIEFDPLTDIDSLDEILIYTNESRKF